MNLVSKKKKKNVLIIKINYLFFLIVNENFKLFEHTDSVKSRWSKQFDKIHQASMRHRSMVLDSNDAGLLLFFLIIFLKFT